MPTIDILSSSEHRCHDKACKVNTLCQRYLQRNDDAPGVQHAATLRPLWQAHSTPCPKYIGEAIEEE